jgi:hypothetical protein
VHSVGSGQEMVDGPFEYVHAPSDSGAMDVVTFANWKTP